MKRLFGSLLLAAAVTFGASSEAQAQFTFGPQAAFHDDADFGVGAWFSVPMASIHEQVSILANFLYFFPDGGVDLGAGNSVDVSYWELNGGLKYDFPMSGSIVPFVMAGLNVGKYSVDYDGPLDDFIDVGYGDTEIGLNVGGGLTTTLGDSLTGLLGGRIELGGGEGFVIEAGLGFPMGG